MGSPDELAVGQLITLCQFPPGPDVAGETDLEKLLRGLETKGPVKCDRCTRRTGYCYQVPFRPISAQVAPRRSNVCLVLV